MSNLIYWTVLATRWFDKKNGNTYHTVRLYRNSHFFTSKHYVYGYGNHYEQTALELLKENGYCKDCQFYYEVVQEFDGNVLTICRDVSRKKDL